LQALRGMAWSRRRRWSQNSATSPASPADGVPRSGSLGAFKRRHTSPRRHDESWKWGGATNADRGGLELSVPGAHQPRATGAPGGSGQADPRRRVEGAGTAVSALSQARPGGKITHSGHDRDRSRTWRALPGRLPNTSRPPALDALTMADIPQGGHRHGTSIPKLSKAGGTVTARRTLDRTNSWLSSDAGR
jgi:hypothetical protein